jgi:uncharacterized protein (TIGR02421 family)
MTSNIDSEIQSYLDLDRELVSVADEFRMLHLIEWPKDIQEKFLTNYRNGSKTLPHVEYKKHDFSAPLKRLDRVLAGTNTKHPVAQYIHQTARSYWLGHKLVEHMGQPEMLKYSIEIYGKPGDTVAGSSISSVEAAHFFIEVADQFNESFHIGEHEVCVLADTIKSQLEDAIRPIFTEDKINIVVDEKLVPKAAAGVSKVRLRSGTCFSPFDFRQLLEHEVFVHTLTAINGKHQKNITCMGLGAPRTTGTQEGLATFAELVTGAIDLDRLKRIALRVIAVDLAIQGANFIEVFEFFLKYRQSESESYSSTQRIFRGGDPRGGVAFTKDSVYLDGLLRAHGFFRWAMKHQKLQLARVLFSGRMTFDDAEKLAPYAETGLVLPPRYLPPWLSQVPTLGAYLAFSLFANKIRVGTLDKEFGHT